MFAILNVSIISRVVVALFFFGAYIFCSAQPASTNFQSSPIFQSPNVAGLGTFGVIDISPFTGLASIGIDVFSLQEGDISVDCKLNYFSGGVKLASHPGWVGQNWTLDVGGVVTRKVNGGVDEVATSLFPADDKKFAYYYHYDYLNNANWATTNYVKSLYPNNADINTPIIPNLAPDEFFFSLPDGTSGSFFLNHLGKWVVKTRSGADLKVVVKVNTDDAAYPQPFSLTNVHNKDAAVSITIARIIYLIEITNQNGFRYTFGNSPEAIEFDRGPRTMSNTKNEHITANAWYLTKIESPKGNKVDFIYVRGFYQYVQGISYPGSVAMQMTGGVSSYSTSREQYSGQIISPSYLKKIESPSFKVDFVIAETNELKYNYQNQPFKFFKYQDLEINDIGSGGDGPDNGGAIGNKIKNDYSKWFKLTDITISDGAASVKSKYTFGYNDNSTERLFLQQFSKVSLLSSDQDAIYNFSYNSTALPGYNILQTDRWGYYNGIQFPSTINGLSEGDINSNLIAVADKAQVGMLKDIIYPTGGKTSFTYQLNDYSKVITKTGKPASINLDSQTGSGGGLRIWKITNTDNMGGVYTTEYSYVDPATGTSSGILAGNKRIYNNINLADPTLASIQAFQMNDIETLNYTNGRDVVYSKVKKILPDQSYTLYTYSNSNTAAYKDELPANTFSDAYLANSQSYAFSESKISSNNNPFPSSISRELERGQLMSQEDFSSGDKLVHSVSYGYNDSPNRFDEFVRSYENYTVMAEALSGNVKVNERYFQAVKTYTYYPYLKTKTETFYNLAGTATLATTTNFDYGLPHHRQVTQMTSTDSKGDQKIELSVFNKDIIIGQSTVSGLSTEQTNNFTAMYNNRNMIVPVQVDNMIAGVLKNRTRFSYKTNYLPDFIENAMDGNALEKKVTINQYDAKGNILESQKTNNIKNAYLYEYNVPVAEIINSGYASVAYSGFEGGNGNWNIPAQRSAEAFTGKRAYDLANGNISFTSAFSNTYRVSFWSKSSAVKINNANPSSSISRNGWTYFEATVSSVTEVTISGVGIIDELRLCPSTAQMTTYSYDPLVGYTNSIDQNGIITYYEYDNQNRLKLIKDSDGNILKSYKYNYQLR